MPAFRWEVYGEPVLDEIAEAPLEVRQDFARLLDQLTRNPRHRRASVRPLRAAPGGYSAPFDDALLVYQVLADYPRIHLLLVVWAQPAI